MVQYTEWRSISDGSIISSIPDSVVLQYFGTTYSDASTTWEDDNDVQDMTLTGGETATTINGSDAVGFDGLEDHGLIDLPPAFDGSGLNEFSIELSLAYTDGTGDEIAFWFFAADGDQVLGVRANFDADGATANEGQMLFDLRDDNDQRFRFSPSNNPNLNDGDRHDISIIIEDASNNDATLIIDGSEVSLTFLDQDSPDNFKSWSVDLAVAAGNDNGSINAHFEQDCGAMRWHDEAIEEQTIDDYAI